MLANVCRVGFDIHNLRRTQPFTEEHSSGPAQNGTQDQNYARARKADAEQIAALPCAFGAAHDLVEADAEQPRYDLLLRDLFAVALRSRVGGNGLLALFGDRAVRADLEAHGRREALALRVARLAGNNHVDDPRRAAERFEASNFFVDVFALRRVGRA